MRCTKVSAEFDIGGHSPWVHTPENLALGYDVGKMSAGCVVIVIACDMLGLGANNLLTKVIS